MKSAMLCTCMVRAVTAVLIVGVVGSLEDPAKGRPALYGYGVGDPITPLATCKDDFSKITSRSSASTESCRDKALSDACTYILSSSRVKGCCAMDDGK